MQIQIQVLSVTTETKPTAKGSYQMLEVAYKDLSNEGKVASKKIMSFTNKKVFDTLAIAKPATVFTIAMEKNDKGYWDWKEVTRGEGTGVSNVTQSSTKGTASPATSSGQTKGGWETPEERAKKQVYIIRQSSLSTAVTALTATGKTIPKAEEVIELAKQFEDYVFSGTSSETVVTKDVGSIETMEEDLPY